MDRALLLRTSLVAPVLLAGGWEWRDGDVPLRSCVWGKTHSLGTLPVRALPSANGAAMVVATAWSRLVAMVRGGAMHRPSVQSIGALVTLSAAVAATPVTGCAAPTASESTGSTTSRLLGP